MKRTTILNLTAVVTLLALAVFPGAAFASSDTTAPAVSAVAAAPNPAIFGDTITLTASVDDNASGASNIGSAEYNIDGGSFSAMSASDGAFDSAAENVTASFAAPSVGDHQICVHGTDASNNTSADLCISLTVQSIYKFGGFKPPVRPGVVNMANAPRTIPLKFRLTKTADGSVVSDPSAISAVKSYQVDCTSLTGDSSKAVTEKNPGKSGLRYLNLGNWIFNWKTDKSYAGTCRNLFVVFADGSTSPEVTFQFR